MGLGVKANMQQALAYLNSAANYGHVLAQYNLAMLHLQNSPTDKYDATICPRRIHPLPAASVHKLS